MILNKEMALKIVAAFKDPSLVKIEGGEKQVCITEDIYDGTIYFSDRRTGGWKGKELGRAYNPCDEIFWNEA